MFRPSGRRTSRRTRRTLSSRAATLVLPVLLAGCATAAPPAADRPERASPAAEITGRLHASADAWNNGDLGGFLDPYLDSPETTFVGGSGLVRGLDRVRAGYETSYWGDGSPEQRLRFGDLEVRPLGRDHALTTGRYILADGETGRTAATGLFTLVWRRTADGWRIIHDHSSAEGS